MPGFDDATKARVRTHLGYPATDATLIQQGGVGYVGEAAFVLEYAMNTISDDGVVTGIKYLDIMDTIETQMVDALQRLQASKADVVTLNPTEHLDLQTQYGYWQKRLARLMNVSVFEERGTHGINFRIR